VKLIGIAGKGDLLRLLRDAACASVCTIIWLTNTVTAIKTESLNLRDMRTPPVGE
jgi:hypothetical protein